MSILIKGMEMPKSCEDCPLVQETENYYGDTMSRVCNLIYKGYTSEAPKGGRLPDCPLVPVPPHGRLIDADALVEDLEFDVENDQRALDNLDIVGKERAHIQFDKDCKQNCMWYLSYCPTIIPAEEGE